MITVKTSERRLELNAHQEHWTLAHMLRWPDDKVDVMNVIDKMGIELK